MNSPLVSIIIPVYNVRDFLPACIDSILHQSYQDFECILIDDGSTDDSGIICDEYARKDIRFRVFHKENGGVSSARNIGIENAHGDWLYFVDADDLLLENCLQTLYDCSTENIDLLSAGFVKVDKNNYQETPINSLFTKEMSKSLMLDELYYSKDFEYNGYVWNKFFRSSIIVENQIRFSENIYFNEDRLFIVGYVCAMPGVCKYMTTPIYTYYNRNDGAMASLNKPNPKYETDFYASKEILTIIKGVRGSSHQIEQWEKQLIVSYYNVITQKIKTKSFEFNIFAKLTKSLNSEVSCVKTIKYCVMIFAKRLRSRFKGR